MPPRGQVLQALGKPQLSAETPVPQREAALLLLTGLYQAPRLGHEERRHLRGVDDQQRVTALVALEHDPILAVEADRPVRLKLDDGGQHDLLAEIPVQVRGIDRRHHVAQLMRDVAPQPRQRMHDAQLPERIAAAGDLRRDEIRSGHAGRRLGEERCAVGLGHAR